jgi:hypothetical protein
LPDEIGVGPQVKMGRLGTGTARNRIARDSSIAEI